MPSALKDTLHTVPLLIRGDPIGWSVVTSHRRIVLSSLLDAKMLPSALNATLKIALVDPVKVERRDERRYGHGRKHRDHRRHKNDWAPFNDGDAWGHPEDVGPSRR